MEKKAKIIIVLAIITAITIPSVYFGIQAYMKSQVEGTTIDVKSISVKEIGEESMVLNAEFDLKTPTDLKVPFNLSNMKISYNGTLLGTASLSKSEFTTTDAKYETVVTISISNKTNYHSLIEDFVDNSSLIIAMSGTVELTGSYASAPAITLSKDVNITALNGIKVDIVSFKVLNLTQNIIDLEIETKMNNTSSISAKIPGIAVDISYKGINVGYASKTNISLVTGMNNFTFIAKLNGSGNTLITDFINNATISFSIVAKLQLTETYNSTKSVPIFTDTLKFSGLDELPVNLTKFTILNFTDTIIDIEVEVLFNNTSSIEAHFKSILVDIIYEGEKVGIAKKEDFNLSVGVQNVTFVASLNGSGNNLISDYMEKTSLEFILNGKVQIAQNDSAEDLVQIFVRKIQIAGFGNNTFSLTEFEILSANGDMLTVKATAQFVNPSQIELTVTGLEIEIFYKGELIGETTQSTFNLTQGVNEVIVNLEINGSKGNLIDNFIQNDTLTFTVNVTATIDQKTEKISRDVDVAGLGGLKPTVNSFRLLNATNYNLAVEIMASFENPSALNANLTNFWIEIIYESKVIGNASKSSHNLIPGTNLLNITASLGDNQNEISNLISQYINGNQSIDITLNITVNATLSASGSEIEVNQMLSTKIQGATGDLVAIAVTNIAINPSGPTYTVDTTVTINNPVDFEVTVDSFTGTLKYNDLDGASIVFPPASYPAANNITITPISFTSWSLVLPASGSNSDIELFNGNNLEQAIRLNDEYLKQQLRVNIYDGSVTIMIGSYSIQSDVVIENVLVT
jgi:uncharacterized protein DUF3712